MVQSNPLAAAKDPCSPTADLLPLDLSPAIFPSSLQEVHLAYSGGKSSDHIPAKHKRIINLPCII